MNESRVDAIYEILTSMVIKLERDPAAVAPGYIQGHLAQCSDYSSELSNLMVEVGRARSTVERAIELLKQQVEIKYSEALINDPEIKKRRNAADRVALAKLKVAEDSNLLSSTREKEIDLRYLSDALKRKERELKIANSDIRLQSKVMEIELDLSGKTKRVPPDNPAEGEEDPPINEALKRGDGTPMVAVEKADGLDPEEGAPAVPCGDVDVESLVSGMGYDVPEVREETQEEMSVEELLDGLS